MHCARHEDAVDARGECDSDEIAVGEKAEERREENGAGQKIS